MSTQPDNRWLDKLAEASPHAKHIAWTGELIFMGAREDDKVGRTAKFDIRVQPEDAGRANPFGSYTRRRAGHAGTRFQASMAGIGNGVEWIDEVMLLGWNDGPKGQTVTFLLSPQADRHPFMGTTRGAQFAAVLLEIGDDEHIVDQVKRERVERAPQRLSNAAAQIIKNPRYWEYSNVEDAASADFVFKTFVDISSKRELDVDPEAVKRFRLHMENFESWQKQKGYL